MGGPFVLPSACAPWQLEQRSSYTVLPAATCAADGDAPVLT
jgi:hypothetical protein